MNKKEKKKIVVSKIKIRDRKKIAINCAQLYNTVTGNAISGTRRGGGTYIYLGMYGGVRVADIAAR